MTATSSPASADSVSEHPLQFSGELLRLRIGTPGVHNYLSLMTRGRLMLHIDQTHGPVSSATLRGLAVAAQRMADYIDAHPEAQQ